MKLNKITIPICISGGFSLLTIFAVRNYSSVALLVLPPVLAVLLGSYVAVLILRSVRPAWRRRVSLVGLTIASMVYLGAVCLSLSGFRSEIAQLNIDTSMLGAGIAWIAIALGFATHYMRQAVDDLSTEDAEEPVPAEDEKSIEAKSGTPSLGIVLLETRRRLDSQLQQIDGLDNKAGIVLAVSGVVLTLLVTSLVARPNGLIDATLFKIAIPLILLSLVLSFLSISLKSYHRPPKLERLWSHYVYQDVTTTEKKIAGIITKAVRQNQPTIDRRILLWRLSYYSLAAGLIVLAVWVVKVVWGL